MTKHFGVKVFKGKYGLKLERDQYALINKRSSIPMSESMPEIYDDSEGKFYTDEFCEKRRADYLINFDLNMTFYSNLDREEFNTEIENFKKNNPDFEEVKDLNKFDDVPGYYMMVLDNYCQVYIGTTNNIMNRIRSHWRGIKLFDRLMLPVYGVETSILSIDSFRALDTTRIFALKDENIYEYEEDLISSFSPKFCGNRLGGGRFLGSLFMERKTRDLK